MTATLTPTIRESKSPARPRMATDIPASITTPDNVQTRLGTLHFFDGFPDEATAKTLYDNLDFQRATQAFLTALPAATISAWHTGILKFGKENQTVLIAESLVDSRSLVGMPNSETVYAVVWLDTKAGPVVMDLPPHVLGYVNDSWGRYVGDVGNAGPDRGKGGKYLLLPPGYTDSVPEGYFVLRSPTYGVLMVFRGFVVGGDTKPTVAQIKQHFRVYPLAQMADPPATTFVNISGVELTFVPVTDATFFETVAQVVQDEPLNAIEPEMRGLLATIGIQKDKPFEPDKRMQSILTEAAAVGNATSRVEAFSTRDKSAFYYPGSWWKILWIGGYDFSPEGVLKLDARSIYFYLTSGVSPAMTVKMVGIGSQYAWTERDAAGRYLDGGKNYRMHLPGNIPAKDFWSLMVHDPQTRSMLQTDQRLPSVSRQTAGLQINADTSVDVYFGPKAPAGKESNWIQTIPGKGWFVALRLYGPLEAWFDHTWRPGDIELAG